MCWENPENKGKGGAAKSALIPPAPPVPEKTTPTQEELEKKAHKSEKNKKYRTQKKEREKQQEAKKADKAKTVLTVTSEESMEEDSPRKTSMAKKSLFQALNKMSEEDAVEFGRKLDRCYKAKLAVDEDDSAVIFGDLHTKLVGAKSSRETMVMDLGCTRDIVA